MGLSTKLNSILQNPLVETIINLLKKLKSSKSYWSVSYLVLLFTFREAIAWKFGSAIETFFNNQAETSDYAFIWELLGFIFSTGGSIELVILGVVLFSILSSVKIFESKNESDTKTTISTEAKEIKATQTQQSQDLQEIKNLIKLQGGDETAFLEKYFGSDYQEVLKNPQTYQNLKAKLQQHQGSIQTLLEEKEKLQNKIEARRLHSNNVQKMIDKAFKELRFDDVLDLLDHFIENNQELEKDLLNAHYQKALAYMEQLKYHEAKEEYETHIPRGIKDTDILHDYGVMYRTLGEYDNSLTLNTRRLELLLKSADEHDTEIARTYNEMGVAWESKGAYDKAIEFHKKALEITLATLGENHPNTATMYNNIGLASNSKGSYDKAIEFYNKALNAKLVILGEKHPSTASTYNTENYGKRIQLKCQ